MRFVGCLSLAKINTKSLIDSSVFWNHGSQRVMQTVLACSAKNHFDQPRCHVVVSAPTYAAFNLR
jgi:hypothetical protein